jgi:hypothetical protein
MNSLYSRGGHNAARGVFWCSSPLTEGAAPNRQEIFFLHFRVNKIWMGTFHDVSVKTTSLVLRE